MNTMWVVSAIMQWIVLLLLSVTIVGILRYLGRVEDVLRPVTRSVSRFTTGQRVADFAANDATGQVRTLKNVLEGGRRSTLLFISTTCQACTILVDQLRNVLEEPHASSRLGDPIELLLAAPQESFEHFAVSHPGWHPGTFQCFTTRKEVLHVSME